MQFIFIKSTSVYNRFQDTGAIWWPFAWQNSDGCSFALRNLRRTISYQKMAVDSKKTSFKAISCVKSGQNSSFIPKKHQKSLIFRSHPPLNLQLQKFIFIWYCIDMVYWFDFFENRNKLLFPHKKWGFKN